LTSCGILVQICRPFGLTEQVEVEVEPERVAVKGKWHDTHTTPPPDRIKILEDKIKILEGKIK
jgi:hypothetical protein